MASAKLLYESIWAATADIPTRRPLHADTTADVCIVGAGMAGLMTAYALTRMGRKVVVIDDGPLAGGQTTVTTAHLSNEIDDRYSEIERIHGIEAAYLAAESHTAAIELIENIVRREGIECGFERLDGYLFAPPEASLDVLDQEFDAVRRTGIVEVERASRVPWPGFETGPCLRFPNQAQFHPLKFLARVAEAIEREGGELYANTHAGAISGGEHAHVETTHGPVVSARSIVVATNTPVNDLVAIHTKQAPYLSYVVGAEIPAHSLPRALYWDTQDPYHYVRLQTETNGSDGATREILIVGGEDHKTGQAVNGEERYARLEDWARDRFPMIRQFEYRWSGQVMETIDGLAFIGRNPLDHSNVYVVTGDSGMGMTHGAIASILLTDMITGKDNRWATLYDPSRKPLRAVGRFARENLNVAAQYATGWVAGGDVRSVDDIRPGEGAVLRHGLTKVAVYRDEAGRLTEMSAICPHLMCIVAWNAAEQTWDCPCHGSRFTPHGEVMNGPANCNLCPHERE